MKEFTVTKNDAGQRLDRFIAKAIPLLSSSLAQKYIRIKRIKVNGKRALRDYRLLEGDTLQLYINDEFFVTPDRDNSYLLVTSPELDIVYEDENILLVDKKPGVLCHCAGDGPQSTLIAHIKAHLYQSGQWREREERSFVPALCNRIDRNTGGLVIAAKNAKALQIINAKIKNREIDKYYLCIAVGIPAPPSGTLTGYLSKDEARNRVSVQKSPGSGKAAVTEYKTLAVSGELALLECRIITGRTHQIRAQLADAGYPLLGDMKYGSRRASRLYNESAQALCSYRLNFSFTQDADILNYLSGKEFTVRKVDFAEKYFNHHI